VNIIPSVPEGLEFGSELKNSGIKSELIGKINKRNCILHTKKMK